MAHDLADRRFVDPGARKQLVTEAAKRSVTAAVLDALTAFNQDLGDSAERSANLKRLAAGNCAVVATGQQVGLFLSPQLVLSKALGAIKTAEALEAETGIPCVPLFWLQTEDHDYEEIRKAYLPNSTGQVLELALPPIEDSKLSVALLKIPGEVAALHELLAKELGRFAPAPEMLELVKACYTPGATFVSAFAKLLAACTAQYGLLLFDSRAEGARATRSQIATTAFERHPEIEAALTERTAALNRAGIETQVTVRANSPLFFFHTDNSEGPRYRVVAGGADTWNLVGSTKTVSTAELKDLLASSPERFSTSALLRPLFQDTLFPTAAYIGGPAELRYMAQISPLYPLFGRTQPLVIPRPALTLVEPKINQILEELQLNAEQLQRPAAETVELVLAGRTHAWLSPTELQALVAQSIEELFAKLTPNIAALDSTLLRPLEKSRGKVENDLSGLQTLYRKSCEQKDEVVLGRLHRALSVLRPREQEQDRVLTPVYFLCRYGFSVVDTMYASIVPFTDERRCVRLDA